MESKSRRRVPAVDVLQTDIEYCSIAYYAEGEKNNLGEPERTLTQRATNVKCAIDPLAQTPAYVRRSGVRDMLRQGIVEALVFIITLSTDQSIESGDVVTDCDGNDYDVLHVMNWYTHKEAFVRQMN